MRGPVLVSQGASCKKGCPSKRGKGAVKQPPTVQTKEEYEYGKYAKSAVESVKSRLAWWRKRVKEHKLPTHHGTPPAPGVFFEKSWLQVCWGVLERGEENSTFGWDTLGRMLWIWTCGKANVRAKLALGLLRSAVLLTCRSWQISLWVLIPCAQESPCSHAKELCVALGGPCAKSSCPLPDACKSSSSKVKGVVAVFSICPSPKLTAGPREETHARLRMFSLRWWRQVLVSGQGGQEVIPWCSSSCASWCSPDSSNEADMAFC